MIIGPAYALAMEKEDGTLLRHKAVPHGLRGYFTGQLIFQSLDARPADGRDPRAQLPALRQPDGRAVRLVHRGWVLVLGLLATMPIGMVIGALVPNTQKVGTWGCCRSLVRRHLRIFFFPDAQLGMGGQVVAFLEPDRSVLGLGILFPLG